MQTTNEKERLVRITVRVTRMTCASCVRRVERALTKKEGVAEALGAALAFALIALWALFRVVPPPGAGSVEEVREMMNMNGMMERCVDAMGSISELRGS